jgi:hypothetical protein
MKRPMAAPMAAAAGRDDQSVLRGVWLRAAIVGDNME